LIITPEGDFTVTLDTIEVGQFVYLLLHNEKIRDVIIGKKSRAPVGPLPNVENKDEAFGQRPVTSPAPELYRLRQLRLSAFRAAAPDQVGNGASATTETANTTTSKRPKGRGSLRGNTWCDFHDTFCRLEFFSCSSPG
jgi:hypothetical protein